MKEERKLAGLPAAGAFRHAAAVLLLAVFSGLMTLTAWAAADLGNIAVNSFRIEQVYANAPDLDVFFYAKDNAGEALDPNMVTSASPELYLGDKKLKTGLVSKADDDICSIFIIDNGTGITEDELESFKDAVRDTGRKLRTKDQTALYTTAGDQHCVLTATTDRWLFGDRLNKITIQKGTEKEEGNSLTDIVTKAASDIETEFSNLARRKVIYILTNSETVLQNVGALIYLQSSDADYLNAAVYILAVTENAAPEETEQENTASGGKSKSTAGSGTGEKSGPGSVFGSGTAETEPAESVPDREDLVDKLKKKSGAADKILTSVSSGRLAVCSRENLTEKLDAIREELGKALEIKTAIADGDAGEKAEILKLSVPSLGSAVSLTKKVYMGHRREKPKVQTVAVTDRNTVRLTFNQAVTKADTVGNYIIRSADIWNWAVPVKEVQLIQGGKMAVLTLGDLYSGNYTVRLNHVASAVSAANTSGRDTTAFSVDGFPRDRIFYLGRFREFGIFAAVLLLILGTAGILQKRKDKANEAAAEAEALLSYADYAPGDSLPKRWITFFVNSKDEIAERRYAGMAESSVIIGSDRDLCDFCVKDPKVRPQHCILMIDAMGTWIEPLDHADVYCGGDLIGSRHILKNDDVITIGDTVIKMVL